MKYRDRCFTKRYTSYRSAKLRKVFIAEVGLKTCCDEDSGTKYRDDGFKGLMINNHMKWVSLGGGIAALND